MNQPEAGGVQTVLRRRRTSRHRRNRRVRRVLLAGVVLVAVGFGVSFVALHYLSPSLFRASGPSAPDMQFSGASQNVLLLTQQETLRQVEDRPVYPYSVVKGGVRDVSELKWAAEHDPVVRAHYARFDYEHARVIRLLLARSAYISYRVGNKIFWTRRQVKLKKGEKLITDGKITARARCGNRVEEVPQQETSTAEPPAAKLDQPEQPATGTAVTGPPVPFQSALLNRPGLAGPGAEPPLGIYSPFNPGTWTPIAPPPLPGICGEGKKHTGTGGGGTKGKGNPCTPSGEVPEPGTWLLMGSGLALMGWKMRNRFART